MAPSPNPAPAPTLEPARPRLAPWIAIASAATLLTAALACGPPARWAALGLLAMAGVAGLLRLSPGFALALIPVLFLPPQFAKVFAHELALGMVAAALVAYGLRTRAAWVARLEAPEAAFAALLLWGVLTGFWSSSPWWWLFGVRKLGIGLLALWTAWRIARWVSGEQLRLGITLAGWALAVYTLAVAAFSGAIFTTGWIDRKRSTDVGWGTSNYIAAILVLILPTTMEVALRDPRRAARWLAWSTLPLAAMVMSVAASRGGSVLIVVIVLLAVFRQRATRGALTLLGVLTAVIASALLLPGSARLLSRFTDLQELGSVVVRLLYFREGWRRLVEAWPWGLGLGQGYVTIDRLGTEDPHNHWLVLGSELGLAGLVLWTAMLVLMWRRIRALQGVPRTMAAGWTMGLTFVIAQVNCLFEPTFQGLHYMFLFFWIAGCYLGSAADRAAGAPGDSRSAM